MIGLRALSLGGLALFLGFTSAVPVHHPQPGEIVHIRPDRTTGGSVGTGAGQAHPHIVLGHVANGHYAVAPVTHNSGSDHLKPHMPTPQGGNHALHANSITRLDHITAHANDISRSGGVHRNTNIGPQGLADIRAGKSLVAAHHQAAHAHDGAAHAFGQRQAHHDALSAHHFSTGNTADGAHHGQRATHYGNLAADHQTAAANHRTAAHNVSGGDATQHAHALDSARHATDAHRAMGNANWHEGQAHVLSQVPHHVPGAQQSHADAAWHAQQPVPLRAAAATSSGQAIASHTLATS